MKAITASSNRTFVMTPLNATKAAFLSMPLLWTCYVLTVVLYTGSLLVTAYLVRQVEGSVEPNLSVAVTYLRSSRSRWISFVLRMLFTLLAAGAVLWCLGYILLGPPLMGRFSGRTIGYAIGFLLEALVAAVLMQPALRLVADKTVLDLKFVRAQAISLGAITIGLQILLTILSDRVLSIVVARQTSMVGFLACEAAQSLLGSLTYLPLFIGLALLTAPLVSDDQPFE